MGARTDCGSIFVVDDDESIRDVLVEVLEDAGYVVRVAKNGADALEHLRELDQSPCLILLDLMMPVMDGFEFRARQLADGAFSNVPVVVFSADGATTAKAAALNVAGALRKPVRLDDVLRAVEAHCAHRRGGSSAPHRGSAEGSSSP
jgi:CheY-like chemotaxis protein